MKAHLMHRDRDFELKKEILKTEWALIQDLELETIFEAMGKGDAVLMDVARNAFLSMLYEPSEIRYRQEILKDCIEHPDVIRQMYAIASESVRGERKVYFGLFSDYPGSVLSRAVEVLTLFASSLAKLRRVADEHKDVFASEGIGTLLEMIRRELDDDYLAEVGSHLAELRFRRGVLIGATLGESNTGKDFVLHRQPARRKKLIGRALSLNRHQFTFTLGDRDESGATALSELKDRSINKVANAAAVSADHILSFFNMLGRELAFYVGCLNLHDRLVRDGRQVCFPVPVGPGKHIHSAAGLYDIPLALKLKGDVTDNDLAADGKELAIITGANRGGKSTFLRSVGTAQLMMQCGMFAPARSFSADVCSCIYTHFTREEDVAMHSGRLEEELGRMRDIVDVLKHDSLMLLNESFAGTNEREGSEIARQVISALLERKVRIFFVTHFFELAEGFFRKGRENVLFLRAERLPDGGRTFRITDGAPLPTSHGEDLYKRIFADRGTPPSGNNDRPS